MFNSSVAIQCQVIQVISDTILEIDEIFFINLEVSDPDVLLENNTATVIIANDDRKLFRVILFYHIMIFCSSLVNYFLLF